MFRQTGLKVRFGPVDAKDIKDYIAAGKKKTPEMKRVHFTFLDRLVLTPMEVIPAAKKFFIFAVIVLLFFGLQPSGIIFKSAWESGAPFLLLGLVSLIGGSFITPALLPFIPFRSFAVKGWIVGILSVAAGLVWAGFWTVLQPQKNILILIPEILFFPMAGSYLALQFTGSTTFTNISGVKKELKIALPVYLISAAVSVVLLIIYKLRGMGVI